MVLDELRHPIVQAPLAGGPSTTALAVAVGEAGALGFLAAGYRKAEDVRAEIRELREHTAAPFGVNVFVPGEANVDEAALERYVEQLGPEAGDARFDDDHWEAKLAVLREERVPLASFTFGCPPADVIASLRDLGTDVWVTITGPAEASAAAAAGATALVTQGIEAGGHRAIWVDSEDAEELALLPLLRLAADAAPGLPLVAAGGISDGPAVAAALAAGASAVQVGTAFMRATEAGTNAAHRAALGEEAPTALTRAFTGRQARGIANRFMEEHSDAAPIAYPHVHHATAPLRRVARERGDAQGFNVWAGQAHRLAVEAPAAEIVHALAEDAREALEAAAQKAPAGLGAPALGEGRRGALLDRRAVPEHRGVEVELGEAAEGALGELVVLGHARDREVLAVGGGVRRDEHAVPQQHHLAGAVARRVDRTQPGEPGHVGVVLQLDLDLSGRDGHALVEPRHDLRIGVGTRLHGPPAAALAQQLRVDRVHRHRRGADTA